MNKLKFDPKELSNSKRIFKSATPKGDISWYIKWLGSILILVAMSMRGAEGMIYTDLSISIVGVSCWLVVGILWRDRAVIMVNAIGLYLLLNNIISLLFSN
tara:strand:+ start:602 stop:904 length:303 start_codon:yes stop_codon:yes gene_type:complete